MRLRYLFILTFSLITLVPMLIFWMWPYSKALESELSEVNERHLVIAKNLASSFQTYYKGVTSIYTMIDIESLDNKKSELDEILDSYGFLDVMVLSKSGNIETCIFTTKENCPKIVNKDILTLAKNTLIKDKSRFSTVTEDSSINSGPIFLVVKEESKKIVLGYLSTKHIVRMGKKVAFGKKGHAAVVDEKGNILAHPLDSWIKSRKNISKLSPVKKMLAGKTGVEKFYSPALKDFMIAGYTSVPGVHWGVMVPQPLHELEDKANEIDKTAIFVMIIGLGLALLIIIPISFILIKPLERLSTAIKLIQEGDKEVNLKWNLTKKIPLEIRELKESFSIMMNTIKENEKSISELAYFDLHSRLPNRNYFHELAASTLEDMKNSNQKGAVVFIDFNGFKLINDTYGHRVGDELISLFGKRIIEYFELYDENENLLTLKNNDLKVIPARLGGDEFVILLKDIDSKFILANQIRELFNEVFSSYDLYDGVKVNLTGSGGISIFPDDAKDYTELLKLADMAMYEAKKGDPNTIIFSKTEEKI